MEYRTLLVSLVALWSPALCYYSYQTALPNGQHVPHPCKPNYIWHGVGHLNSRGGGDRNRFGLDFASAGHQWTQELCRKDSDHDGLTNGQELGDPDCVWSQGQIPARTDNITHPGVCDPWDSPQCRQANNFVTCDVGEFQCDAINDPEVRNVTLRFPRTKVPAKETTYMCYTFEFPAVDETYHMIAYEAYIDNPNVMHHILVYSCEDNAEIMDAPEECNMGGMGCNNVIGVWTLGMAGDCIHPDAGFRLGKGAARKIAFQFHWTNKHLVDHWYDSSGVTLYYTPRLRQYDANIMMNGQMYLNIPPAQPSLTTTGSCSASCSQRYVNGSLNIIAALNHMHYLGVRGKVELIRNGHVIKNVTNDEPYTYDNPHVWHYQDPVVMRPGDELKMICEFSSLDRDRSTFYGEGSYDEMCFGIFTYYPAENYRLPSSCVQWKDMDICDFFDGDCDTSGFLNSSAPAFQNVFNKVSDACRYGSCQPECPAALREVVDSTPCLQGRMWEYLKDVLVNRVTTQSDARLLQLIALMDSCDQQTTQPPATAAATTAAATTTTTTTAPVAPSGSRTGADTAPQQSGSSQSMDAAETFLRLARELGSRPLFQNIIFNANQKN